MAILARERQRKRSALLKEKGLHRTTVILSSDAHQKLRQITEQHGLTQSEVLELSILVGAKWLAGRSKNA